MNSDSHKLTVILITLLYCIRGISKQVKCAEITRFCICAIDKVVLLSHSILLVKTGA